MPKKPNIPFLAHSLVIFALAILVRWGYWADSRAYAVGADEPDYVVPAQQFAQEGRYVDTYISRNRIWTRVPLTSIFFAASFALVNDQAAAQAEGDDAALMEPRYDALNIAQIAISLILVGLTMALAWRAFPRKAYGAAILAGYVSALYPPLASSPAQRALSEPLSMVVIFAAILLLTYWSPGASWKRNLLIAAGVGVLLGVGALVRSVAVALLPFACVYFLWTHRSWSRASAPRQQLSASSDAPGSANPEPLKPETRISKLTARPIVSAVVAVIFCFAAISPFTYYNYTQYKSFLLLETANTTAYWHYHNFKRENEDEILLKYPNPADRLSIIVRKGTENIFEYTDQAIGTTIFSFFYAWHLELNSAVLENSWDFTQRDPDVPDLIHTDAAFLLLGLTGLAGLAGVGLRRPVGDAGRTLLANNLWLAAMLMLGVIVPYDARYRLPAAPSLIVLAAGLLVLADWGAVFNPRKAWGILRSHPVIAASTLLLSLWVLIGAYNPNLPPLFRSMWQAWRGDNGSNLDEAVGRYKLAEQAMPNFYWAYRKEAEAYFDARRPDDARASYEKVYNLNPDDPYAMLGFAQLATLNPQWQLTQEEQAWISRDESEWRGNPWNSFTPLSTRDAVRNNAPGLDEEIDVGTGRDIPYVLGFQRPDREPAINYRWSLGRSHIRVPSPGTSAFGPSTLTLVMSAPAVGAGDPMPVVVTIDGKSTPLTVPVGWQNYDFEVNPGSSFVNITIESPTRDLALLQPDSPDKRKLGVGVDKVLLTSPNP